jgi:NAD-dependent deacetylase
MNFPEQIEQLKEMVLDSAKTVILTGAGVSTESGLKDFRSSNGIWKDKEITAIATPQGMIRNPDLFAEFYRWRIQEVLKHEPNKAHHIIAKLVKEDLVNSIITQNVDGYHRNANLVDFPKIIELHGDINWVDCSKCEHSESCELFLKTISCPKCEGMLRPSIVMFNESLNQLALNNAIEAASDCDLMIVIGSSLSVSPANLLPSIAQELGGQVAIINESAIQHQGDLNIIGYKAGDVLEALYRAL